MGRTRTTGWRRRSVVATVTLALVASVASAGTAISKPTDYPLAAGMALVPPLPLPTAEKVSARMAPQGRATAFIELASRPAVDVYNEQSGRGAGRDKARQEARKATEDTGKVVDELSGALRARDVSAQVLYSTVNAVSGMAVTGDAAAIRELAARSEVQSVRPIVPKTRTNANAVQVTQALNTWQESGKLGDRIRLGVIDDGVDYTHATFGGPGTPQAYEAIDRTKVLPGTFPTAKVAGGTDLAGDQYDSAGTLG